MKKRRTNLADGHPFKISTNSVHLPLVNRYATILEERVLGIVQVSRAISIGVVGDLMVIPDRNPWEVLVAGNEIKIGAVGGNPLAVVVERVNLLVRQGDTPKGVAPAIVSLLVFIDIITKLQLFSLRHR
jgi:hypothetical protein